MKNYVKRLLFGLFFGLIVVWLIYLMWKWVNIVKDQYSWQNIVIYIILLVIFLYYLMFYTVRPTYIKYFKVINTCLWLFLITFSHIYLMNSGVDRIFYWDIFSLIWVFLTIIWPTKLLVSKELEDSKKVEIIEA